MRLRRACLLGLFLVRFWLTHPTGLIARMARHERLYGFSRAVLWYAMGWRRPT